MHGGHHGHHHHHHAPAAAPIGLAPYLIALGVNLAFVFIESIAGFWANSTALLADAGHNLSDVLGLALAGAAAFFATRKPDPRRTYGYGKAGALAALGNGLALVAASGAIGWEAARRLFEPSPVAASTVMIVAGIGIVVNAGTALLFARAQRSDVNARGAFLHLLADAGVSAAVIVAGGLVYVTGWSWIDPAISLVVLLVVLISAFALIRDALDLALDAAPASVDPAKVRAQLAALPGVSSVHDLHVWTIGPGEVAVTAHLVRPEGGDDAFLELACSALRETFGVGHVTLQIETRFRAPCEGAHA